MKQQSKFWLNVKEYINNNPDSAFYCFVKQARLLNLKYIKHYELLEDTYITPANCMRTMPREYYRAWKTQFEQLSGDIDSRLITYFRINPSLSEPQYISKIMLERDRVILTRFRCCSHSLKIELCHFFRPRVPREDRIFICNNGVQTILHCFTQRTLITTKLGNTYTDLKIINSVCTEILLICEILNIPS